MKASHVDVQVEAFVVQAVSVSVRPGRHDQFGSEYGFVGWDVEEAVSERVSTSVFLVTVEDDPHPALRDFLLEVRSVSHCRQSTTVKESVDIAVHAAIERAVDRTVSGSVDDASNRAVWRSVASPVDWTVYEAVWAATVEDPSHPAIRGFLHAARRT